MLNAEEKLERVCVHECTVVCFSTRLSGIVQCLALKNPLWVLDVKTKTDETKQDKSRT